jgi:hypothetical protein
MRKAAYKIGATFAYLKTPMSKPFLTLVLAAALAASAQAGDLKSYTFDCEAWSEGPPPADVFVVDGTINIKAVEGNKAIEIGTDPLVDANAQIGTSANGSASIEARVLGTKAGRSLPRFAISVHGQSGYRLMVFPVKKELQLLKGEEIVKTVPLEWTSGAWLKMKLDVKKGADGKWTIAGKAWPATGAEPADPQITHEDTGLKGQGKCSVWATPYSGTPIYFDDIKLQLEQ